MADATSTLKVDGVEPSILVTLVDVKDNPERVKLFTADDGTERFLIKAGKAVLVTNKDLGVLGGFSIEVRDSRSTSVTASAPAQFAPQEELSSPVKNTPGQTG